MKEKGGIYAFYNKYGYTLRNKAESQFSRIKRCIGDTLQTHNPKSQKIEAIVIANILNFWNALGKPIAIKSS